MLTPTLGTRHSPLGIALVALAALVPAIACGDKGPVAPVDVEAQFILAPGQTAAVRGTPLRLLFLRVTDDSRCPADVVCIQAGDALVHVRATDGGSAEYALHAGDRTRAGAIHAGFRIRLEQLAPQPLSTRTIAPGDYRAAFSVAPAP